MLQQKPTKLTRAFMLRWLKATDTPCFTREPWGLIDAQENGRFLAQSFNLLFLEFGELTSAIHGALCSSACIGRWRPQVVETAFGTISAVCNRWYSLKQDMHIHHKFPETWQEQQIAIIDALADITFLCWKTCEGMGVDFREVIERVAESNATKLIDDPVEVLADGRIVKKEHYMEPKIAELVAGMDK